MDVRRALTALWSKSAAVVGLGFLALIAQSAQAQGPLNYFKNYFVTGDYVVGGVGLYGKRVSGPVKGAVSVTGNIALNSVPCTTGPGLLASVIPCSTKGAVPADVIAAFLYWQTIESTTTPSSAIGSYASSYNAATPVNPFVGLALGNPQVSACSGGVTSAQFMHNYRADVLKYLPINSTANVRLANGTQTFTLVSGDTTTQFVGATLVVVYRLITPGNPRIAPLRSVVIYDGAFTGTQSSSLNQTMGGFYQASVSPSAKMTQIVGNGQSISSKQEKQTLQVNGSIPQGVPSDPFVGAQGGNWDNYTFNYNLSPSASSVVTQVPLTQDCLSWSAIITSTNVQDSDFDGLLDVWETSGLALNPGVRNDGVLPSKIVTPTSPATFGTCSNSPTTCLNLPKMGANPFVPDIFMQIDWMQSGGGAVPAHVHIPQLAALNMVGSAFQQRGINLHFDVGNNYQTPASPFIIPAAYARGGNVVPESGNLLCPNAVTNVCAFPQQEMDYSLLGWKSGLDAIKNGDSVLGLPQLFAQNRKDTFHYALFAHGIAATTPLSAPLAGSISGVGDLPGGDLLVTLGLWRSDAAAVDQVGTVLEQAGTLMHELGHNLDLHHGGWNNTPVCMADYPSVMNYSYQVAGLTDSSGTEHIDYSYGLLLPMSEDLLSSSIPMGLQKYRVRYFGPFNSATNTPGQASQVFCNGQLLTGSEGKYVRLEGPTVSTPDWSNGTVAAGKLITSGLDINYDGSVGQTYTDSPDWYSLNLQQVGARPNANGLSLNVGISDIGISDIGISDIGISDIGISDIGISDIGISDIGISDIGTAQLGQDALGDSDQATVNSSGGAAPPTGLMTAVTTNQPSAPAPANPNPGGTGNALTWTGGASEVAFQYNIYRCNASTKACTPTGPAIATVTSGSPVITTYTDFVNDYVDAGATCPATSTCYNTNYTYGVTELPQVMIGTQLKAGTESLMSNLVTGEVNHLFVIANAQPTVVYGATTLPFPAPTYTVYPTGSPSLPTTGANAPICVYSSPSSTPRNAATYTITCSGLLSSVPGSPTVGITYNAPNPNLNYPSALGGIVAQGTLTINKAQLTITAAAETKTYDGLASVPLPLTNPPTITGLQTQTGYGDSVTGLAETYTEQVPNVGTGLALKISAYTVNDANSGNNYNVATVLNTAGVINKANTTTTIINSVTPSPSTPGLPATVTVTVAPTTTVASGAGPTQTVAVGSTPTALASTCPATLSGVAGSSSATGNCTLTFSLTMPPTPSESITATYGGDSNFVGSTSAPTVLPLLTSIVVAPTARTSYSGDTVWVNDDYPGQGTVLNSGGSASVASAGGTTFSVASGGISVNVTGTTITVTFPNGWTFNTTPVSFDGLVITDPVATITGVSLATTNITGYTGSPSQLYSDGNDVYINFPHPAFSTLPTGASISVNVQFANSPPASIIPGETEQFTATGIYNSGVIDLTALAGWSANSTPSGAATISSTGLATAVSTGISSSVISANYGFLFSNTPTLTVAPALVSIAVTPTSPFIVGTNTQQFTATGTYTDGSIQPLTNLVMWTSSATGVATITTAGLASGVAPGTTTISATLGGVTGTMSLTVNVDLSTLVLNGSAGFLAGPPPVLQLTNNLGGETSSAWLTTEQSVATGFSTSFQFQITPSSTSPNSIGDGFAFVIQAQNGTTPQNGTGTLGATGFGMYIGYDGIPNSIAIEFDTYENGQYADPAGPHIGIQSNGKAQNSPAHNSGANLGGPVLATFADGNVHTATITYDGIGTLSVSLDGNFVVSAPVNLSTLLSLDSGGSAFVGFTAATGGAQENSDILGWTWN